MSKAWRNWVERVLWLAVLFPGLISANVLGLRLYAHSGHDFVIGARSDDTMLQFSGFYNGERSAAGTTYRWSEGQSSIGIRSFVTVLRPILSLKLGEIPAGVQVPRPVQLQNNGSTLLTLPGATTRRYEVVLPSTTMHDGMLDLTFTSAPLHVDPDPRELGLPLADLVLSWSSTSWLWPSWQALIAQWAIVVVVLASLRRFAVSKAIMLSTGSGLVVVLGWFVGREPFMPAAWETTVLEAALAICAGSWALPILWAYRRYMEAR